MSASRHKPQITPQTGCRAPNTPGPKNMKTVQVQVYEFSELDATARQAAIDAMRDINTHFRWYDSTIDDAKTIGACLGFTIDDVFFSGFASQGDGACFVGSYAWRPDASNAVREYAPKDETLHAIADELTAAGREGCTATITKRSHQYSHEFTVDMDFNDDEYTFTVGQVAFTAENETRITEAARRFMKWIYRALETEYEYQSSDAAIIETIEANDYEFLRTGRLAGACITEAI